MLDLIPYYVFFIFIFLLYNNMKEQTSAELSQKTGRVKYLFWVMSALWILIGMRNVLYGRDTLGYVTAFKSIEWRDLKDSVEPGYTLLTCIAHTLSDNYHVYLMIVSIITVVIMYKMMKRYFSCSYEIVAAICIYTLLGMLAFNMAALRQTIAVSLGMLAFMYADDGKWKQFLVCVVVAYTFHNSAFILLVLYPLRYLNLQRWGIWGVGAVLIIGFVSSATIAPFIQAYLPMEERFSQYGTIYESSQNYTGFFLQLILVVIAYIRKDHIELEEKTKNLFFNAVYIGLAIQSLTMAIAELYRVSFFFSCFNIILTPLALMTFKGENGKKFRIWFIIGTLVYIFILSGDGVLPMKQDYNVNGLL